MRAGHVVSIRVNPRDCQSILDVLDAAGVPRQAMSFPQCTSLALGALLETARQNGLIPEPDEFEYLNRMSQYLGKGRKRQSARIANELHGLGGELRAPVLEGGAVQRPGGSIPTQTDGRAEPATPRQEVDPEELERAKIELSNLNKSKEEMELDGTWTPQLEDRFQALFRVVYPDG